MKTKWDIFIELFNEFTDALPDIAKECDVDVFEAQCDKCLDKRYNDFRKIIYSDFKEEEA